MTGVCWCARERAGGARRYDGLEAEREVLRLARRGELK
jgi:hypothetical protein